MPAAKSGPPGKPDGFSPARSSERVFYFLTQPSFFMFSQSKIIWSILRGQRLRYGLALACLVVATVINFGVPLVGSATIDFAVSTAPQAGAPPLMKAMVASLGGASYLRAHLWLAPVAMVVLSLFSGVFSYL